MHTALQQKRQGTNAADYKEMVAKHYGDVTAKVREWMAEEEKKMQGADLLLFQNKMKMLNKQLVALDTAHSKCTETAI